MKFIKWFFFLVFIPINVAVAYHFLWHLQYYRVPPISFVKVATPSTSLIGDIQSYQNQDNLIKLLESHSIAYKREIAKKTPTTVHRPPFVTDRVIVLNYNHLGYSGELIFTFLNDRLMSTQFFPNSIDSYLDALNREIKTDLTISHKKYISPYTCIIFGEDYLKRKYVIWEDTRLANEFSVWIRRYS